MSKNIPNVWLAGRCICGYPSVVMGADATYFPMCDYVWYCSNKGCIHHNKLIGTADCEEPFWMEDEDE